MMIRNVLYFGIGVLAVATFVLGYQIHQERQKPTGVQIEVSQERVSMETK